MEAMVTRPGASAAALFPQAAAANRSIFYRGGRPATVAEVHANLQRTAGDHPAVGAPQPSAPPPPPLSEQDRMLAARMDRLSQDQNLLNMLLGTQGEGEATTFLKAFAPPEESRQS